MLSQFKLQLDIINIIIEELLFEIDYASNVWFEGINSRLCSACWFLLTMCYCHWLCFIRYYQKTMHSKITTWFWKRNNGNKKDPEIWGVAVLKKLTAFKFVQRLVYTQSAAIIKLLAYFPQLLLILLNLPKGHIANIRWRMRLFHQSLLNQRYLSFYLKRKERSNNTADIKSVSRQSSDYCHTELMTIKSNTRSQLKFFNSGDTSKKQ